MKIVMSDDQFTKLFQYVGKRFDEVAKDMAGVRQDVRAVYDRLDEMAKEQETERQERVAILRQLERHERWHHQTADKIGLKLDYQAQ